MLQLKHPLPCLHRLHVQASISSVTPVEKVGAGLAQTGRKSSNIASKRCLAGQLGHNCVVFQADVIHLFRHLKMKLESNIFHR